MKGSYLDRAPEKVSEGETFLGRGAITERADAFAQSAKAERNKVYCDDMKGSYLDKKVVKRFIFWYNRKRGVAA